MKQSERLKIATQMGVVLATSHFIKDELPVINTPSQSVSMEYLKKLCDHLVEARNVIMKCLTDDLTDDFLKSDTPGLPDSFPG